MEGNTIWLIIGALAVLGVVSYYYKQRVATFANGGANKTIRDSNGNELSMPGNGHVTRVAPGQGTRVSIVQLLRANRHQTKVSGGPNPRNASVLRNAAGKVLTQTERGLIWAGNTAGTGYVVIVELTEKGYVLRSGKDPGALAGADGAAVAFAPYNGSNKFQASQLGWVIA